MTRARVAKGLLPWAFGFLSSSAEETLLFMAGYLFILLFLRFLLLPETFVDNSLSPSKQRRQYGFEMRTGASALSLNESLCKHFNSSKTKLKQLSVLLID